MNGLESKADETGLESRIGHADVRVKDKQHVIRSFVAAFFKGVLCLKIAFGLQYPFSLQVLRKK